MENDPNNNKKDSKGKKILKKVLRRGSKTSNNSNGSSIEQGASVSRSKSFENQHVAREINDSAPDGSKDAERKSKTENKLQVPVILVPLEEECPPDDAKPLKVEFREPNDASSIKGAKSRISTTAKKGEAETTKQNLKRKLEEDSPAGTSGASTGASDTDADDKDPSKDKKKKNRCAVCRKKVGLTGFECRCGGLFCAVHRYSDKHDCSFDYRELGAQEIRRNNPVVVSQKIHKI